VARNKKMTELRQNQISFLVQSSSILSKLASIIETNPDASSVASSGRRMSTRSQMRESDRVSGLIKKQYEDRLVLLSEVYPFED
jgi:hypothetical protein